MTESPGHLLRQIRRQRGLTQAQLARRAGTGQGHVSRIERDEVSPTVATLAALLQALDSDLELRAVTQPGWLDDDPHQRSSNREMSVEQRLRSGAALSRSATRLAGLARR